MELDELVLFGKKSIRGFDGASQTSPTLIHYTYLNFLVLHPSTLFHSATFFFSINHPGIILWQMLISLKTL